MFYINDDFYDNAYIQRCFQQFDGNAHIGQCEGKRFTVCLQDTALWIALCLYIKTKGGSVFPLPVDTPLAAARRQAQASQSHYLLLSSDQRPDSLIVESLSQIDNDAYGVLVQRSSGTTGDPKVIARRWSDIDREIDAYIQHFPEANAMTPVVAAPVSHSYGLICGVLVAFSRGLRPTIITNLNPKYLLRKLAETPKALLYSSPALITTLALLLKPEQKIYGVMTSGTLMQAATFAQVKAKTQHLYQQYGCSEAGCISLGKDIHHYHDIGVPLPHHSISSGKQPSAPSEILVSNGRATIFTRDLGYFDNSSLHFVSRIDDMINVAGLNVYPTEVENILLTMPAINDAVVFKRKHSLGNEQVCLNFVANNPICAADIRQWCKQQLAQHQIPMHIQQVEKINKLPNGKINRQKLAESIEAEIRV